MPYDPGKQPGKLGTYLSATRTCLMARSHPDRSRFPLFSFCRGQCHGIDNAKAGSSRRFRFLEENYKADHPDLFDWIISQLVAICQMAVRHHNFQTLGWSCFARKRCQDIGRVAANRDLLFSRVRNHLLFQGKEITLHRTDSINCLLDTFYNG